MDQVRKPASVRKASPSQASTSSSKAICSLPGAFSKAKGIGSVRRWRACSTAVGVTNELSPWQKLSNALSLPPQERTEKDIDRILKNVQGNSFFDRYPQPRQRQLAAVCKVKEMDMQGVVFRAGDEGELFYVIIRGTVEVRVKTEEPPYLEVAVNVLKVTETLAPTVRNHEPFAPRRDRDGQSRNRGRWESSSVSSR